MKSDPLIAFGVTLPPYISPVHTLETSDLIPSLDTTSQQRDYDDSLYIDLWKRRGGGGGGGRGGGISGSGASERKLKNPVVSTSADDNALPSSRCTRERRFLRVLVNGMERYALPDTGLNGNAIAEDYALSIGAKIEPDVSKYSFVNARDSSFESVGMTKLVVALPDDVSTTASVRKWACSFAVVKQLAAPLVLGNEFLRTTKTLTSLAHGLVRKTMSVLDGHLLGLKKVWRFMHMDLPRQKLGCFLDAEQVFAAVDSGSDIDVVSLGYANHREWQVNPLPDGEGYVLLANNELVKLAGYVEMPFGIRGGCMWKKFYVLDSLMCDLVLGDPTIEALDLFNKFQDSLIELDAAEDVACFHMIQWVEEQIDNIGLELEQILAGQFERPLAGGTNKNMKRWRSLFGIKSPKKSESVHKSIIMNRLRNMRENVEICAAQWRRSAEMELSTLTGDELADRKAEIDRRKEQNDQVRDRILSHILQLSKSTNGSDDQSGRLS